MIHGRSAFGGPTNDWRLGRGAIRDGNARSSDKLAGGSDAAWNGALHAAAETQSITGPVATTTFFSGDLNPDTGERRRRPSPSVLCANVMLTASSE
jgi:hypothetical protein